MRRADWDGLIRRPAHRVRLGGASERMRAWASGGDRRLSRCSDGQYGHNEQDQNLPYAIHSDAHGRSPGGRAPIPYRPLRPPTPEVAKVYVID